MHQDIQTIGVRVADAAAGATIGTAAVINLSDINQIVQIGAGIVAIVAGLSAAAFHMYKTYDLHKTRKRRNGGEQANGEYPGD